MPVSLDNAIFNNQERRRAFSNLIIRSAKEFKQLTKDRMIYERPTGITYTRGRGETFSRSHRASASGQRPAPDTSTLVNAITDKQISDLESEVYIEDKINPSNGTVASNYGAILQNYRDRPIMSIADVAEAQIKINRDAVALMNSLTSNR